MGNLLSYLLVTPDVLSTTIKFIWPPHASILTVLWLSHRDSGFDDRTWGGRYTIRVSGDLGLYDCVLGLATVRSTTYSAIRIRQKFSMEFGVYEGMMLRLTVRHQGKEIILNIRFDVRGKAFSLFILKLGDNCQ